MAESKETTTATLQLLTVAEAAQFLGLKKSTVYNMTYTRVIPHLKCGEGKRARVRFRTEDLRQWQNARLKEIPTIPEVQAVIQAEAARYDLTHPREKVLLR